MIFCLTKKTLKPSYYTGITNDWDKRWRNHVLGRGAKYTRGKNLLYGMIVENCENRSQAQKIEAQIKKMSYKEKTELLDYKLIFDPDEKEQGSLYRCRADVIPPTQAEISEVNRSIHEGFLKNKKRP